MRDSRGFTLIELIIVAAIIAIVMSIAMPMYLHGRMRANETSAVTTLQAINKAQHLYAQTCGRQKFAASLPALGKPNPGTTEPFLSPDLTQAKEVAKSGYLIRMSGTEVPDPIQTCTGDTPADGYEATADPTIPGSSGLRFFGTNTTVIVYEHQESLNGKMPETGAPNLGQEVRGLSR